MARREYAVTGMTCDHCVRAVTSELLAVPGVSGVAVDLVPGGASTVRIEASDDVTDDAVRAAVDEAGYELA